MDGWKPAERTIDAPVLLDQAVDRVTGHGFTVRERHTGHVILQRPGTQFTLRGERFPLELALAESERGMFLQLRYDTFVLADTGDLHDLADELASDIGSAPVGGRSTGAEDG